MKAREELAKLGPMSQDEKITAGALGLTVSLWIFGGSLGISAVAAALLGLSILLITNVTTWKNCLSDNQVHLRSIYQPTTPLLLRDTSPNIKYGLVSSKILHMRL